MAWKVFFYCWIGAISLLSGSGWAHADLRYTPTTPPDGSSFLIVEGDFSFADDLALFRAMVRLHSPSFITFNSPGGNVSKAIELGRLIRALGLSTLQIRKLECMSACALAFLGGINRYAEPGSIGVHRSSFSSDLQLGTEDAVSTVQAMTAEIMGYMSEMGADPRLLELSLRYDAGDIRFLSGSEMEAYRVVTWGGSPKLDPPSAPAPLPPVTGVPDAGTYMRFHPDIPVARTGRVRHPKGRAPLKASAEGSSPNLSIIDNGTPLRILSTHERWYRVNAFGRSGFMHHTWVFVDQFESGPFENRHIQVKSFDNLEDAETYARSSALPLDVYLATNGWFAVTLENTYEQSVAKQIVAKFKQRQAIPEDSFMTYGNTYARKVCCS